MRLYAFFVFAQFVLAAHAATIPDNTLAAQESLQKLRESFIAQIDTLTADVGTFLNGNRSSDFSPAEERNKAGLQNIRSGLITFKNDFSKGLKILDDYIQFKAANQILERSYPSSDAENMQTFITNFATNIQNGFASVTNSLNNYVIRDQNDFNQGQHVSVDSSVLVSPAEASAPVSSVEASVSMSSAETLAPMSSAEASVSMTSAESSAPMSSAEASASVSSAETSAAVSFAAAPGAVPPTETFTDDQSMSSLYAIQLMKFEQAYQSLLNAYNMCIKKPMQSAEDISSQAKLIKTLLKDNPFNKKIAIAVQNLDREKSRELEKVKAVSDVLLSEHEKTEISPGSENGNNSNDSVVKDPAPVKEVQKKTLLEEAAKPEKTEEVTEKTE